MPLGAWHNSAAASGSGTRGERPAERRGAAWAQAQARKGTAASRGVCPAQTGTEGPRTPARPWGQAELPACPICPTPSTVASVAGARPALGVFRGVPLTSPDPARASGTQQGTALPPDMGGAEGSGAGRGKKGTEGSLTEEAICKGPAVLPPSTPRWPLSSPGGAQRWGAGA